MSKVQRVLRQCETAEEWQLAEHSANTGRKLKIVLTAQKADTSFEEFGWQVAGYKSSVMEGAE